MLVCCGVVFRMCVVKLCFDVCWWVVCACCGVVMFLSCCMITCVVRVSCACCALLCCTVLYCSVLSSIIVVLTRLYCMCNVLTLYCMCIVFDRLSSRMCIVFLVVHVYCCIVAACLQWLVLCCRVMCCYVVL